jgi:tRNA (guanine-N1)-methyltransferase
MRQGFARFRRFFRIDQVLSRRYIISYYHSRSNLSNLGSLGIPCDKRKMGGGFSGGYSAFHGDFRRSPICEFGLPIKMPTYQTLKLAYLISRVSLNRLHEFIYFDYNHLMRFDVFTIFPEVFTPYLRSSILKRALDSGLVEYHIHNIRDWAIDKHHTTDDEPYGGGGGMVMKVEPIFAAVEDILGTSPTCPLILMTPQGRLFKQSTAWELVQHPRIALLAGRYEGIDERVRQHLVTDEISIGDYVLTGGELPVLVLIDAITRLIPGAPLNSGAGRFLKSSGLAIMLSLTVGDGSRLCREHWKGGQNCWKEQSYQKTIRSSSLKSGKFNDA